MKKISGGPDDTPSNVRVYEGTLDEDGVDMLMCVCIARGHREPHFERESAEAFLNHLYDHRLKDNMLVSPKAINTIYRRLKESRRYAREG